MLRATVLAIRTTAVGVLFISFTSLAIAEQGKPQGSPPVTTKGAVKAAPQADKGQATAQAARVEARQRKAVQNADRLQNREQRMALKTARGEPRALLLGIRLSREQWKALNATEQRYVLQLRDIEQQARIAERAGQADPSVVARIEELRRRERAELRNALLARDWARFDRNALAFAEGKP